MSAIHTHTLSSLTLQVRDASVSVGSARSRKSRSVKARHEPNYEWHCHLLITFYWNNQKTPSQRDSERFLTRCSHLWSLALWMGKMAYYETPQCSLSCSKLKGMLLSVWGSPLIYEMLCALWKDQAYDFSQYVCECFDACSCQFNVLSEMSRTAGLGDQPRWVPDGPHESFMFEKAPCTYSRPQNYS